MCIKDPTKKLKKKDWLSFSNTLIYYTGAMEGTMRFTATDH